MARKLATYVHVADDKGEIHVYGPDTKELPAWAVKAITNPAAWADGDTATAAEPSPAAGEDEEPPRAGKGSGRAEWAAYAASVGVEVDDDATRDDIIAAVDAAKQE